MMYILALVGGMLTIASPCILPIIPLVFSRADRSFTRERLPMLVGLAVTFAAVAGLGTWAAGNLLVGSEIGRYAALILMGAVGLSLASTRFAERVARPLTRLGAHFAGRSHATSSVLRNAGVGAAIGLLWAPCAGPILGLVIAGAAHAGPERGYALLLAFAVGAGLSLALLLVVGQRSIALARRAGVAETRVRRVLGVATVLTVLVIGFGLDSAVFAKSGLAQTAGAEEQIVRRLAPDLSTPAMDGARPIGALSERILAPALSRDQGALPSLDGGTEWINSPPLTPESLRGKVVLIDFWTFACYNCLNALPHVKALYAKYKDRGFIVIGVHTPELAHERVVANVRREVKRLGITYPVVIDNDNRIWNAFRNQYWPAAYYADATGHLRYYQFGEGKYDEQDKAVAQLLDEAEASRKQ